MGSLVSVVIAGVLGLGLFNPIAFASDLPTIVNRGRLLVGVKNNLYPLTFIDKSGNLAGLEIDISRQLAQELLGASDRLELVQLTNQERFPALWHDRVDVLVSQVTLTRNRSRLMEFSLPYYIDGTVLVGRKGIKATDFAKKSDLIGVLKGSEAIAVLQNRFPNTTLVGADSYQSGLDALRQGKIKGFVADYLAIAAWLKQNPEFEQIGPKLAFHSLAIALPRGQQYESLRQRVFKIVEGWQQTGWLQERAKAWGIWSESLFLGEI